MTITDITNLGLGAAANSASVASLTSSQRDGQPSDSSDNVSLSGMARLLQSDSSDRAARIASLTSAVRSGTYNVSSQVLSQSLLNETIAGSKAA